jgi:LacI family transcriptional regulator
MPGQIRRIAEAGGVSPPSAAFILRNPATRMFSEDVLRRVLSAARRLGMEPAPRAEQKAPVRCVGLLLSTTEQRSVLPRLMFHGIVNALHGRGLFLATTRVSDDDGEAGPAFPGGFEADGVLVNITHDVPPGVERLVGEIAPPEVWINLKRGANCVYPDDYNAAVSMTRQVLCLGHRRIAYVGSLGDPAEERPHHYSEDDRRDGYSGTMNAAGLTPRVLVPAGPGTEPLHAKVVEELRSGEQPTAVLTYGANSAITVLHAAAELGLRCPRDLSVIGVSDRRIVLAGVATTTMVIPERAMGRAAVGMVLERIEGGGRDLAPRAVKLELVEGETCAPPRG